ncbi:MAG: zinc-ribbon domain-containing protein [Clostridiales bacterium]|nr:zinc-ribbon domain-containing protein [Clostridiales bacterium]
MAFCSRCGAKMEEGARFCAACGTNAQGERSAPVSGQDDISRNKGYAVCAYLGLLFLVPLLAAKDSPFARFHTNQGIWLFFGWIICGIVPIFGWLCSVVMLVFTILGIVNAAQGEFKSLPLVDKLPKIVS